ncbi:MAG TPA: hypothetical protein VG672_08580 [Bryobacteraceae bacterium]|nr:hypothetical protein [Bryobacteraceae bacterium]
MPDLSSRLAMHLAGLLPPAEREAVCGDFAEAGDSGRQALVGVLGLVLRHQAGFWKNWHPWLILATLVLPLALLLGNRSRQIADHSAIYIWLYAANWDSSVLANPAARNDLLGFAGSVLFSYVRLAGYAWIAGLTLAVVSRRSLPVIATLFCLLLLLTHVYGVPFPSGDPGFHRGRDFACNAAVFASVFYRAVLPLAVYAALVVLPSLWGMRQGFQLRPIESKSEKERR